MLRGDELEAASAIHVPAENIGEVGDLRAKHGRRPAEFAAVACAKVDVALLTPHHHTQEPSRLSGFR
jgi:hypothetical protein